MEEPVDGAGDELDEEGAVERPEGETGVSTNVSAAPAGTEEPRGPLRRGR